MSGIHKHRIGIVHDAQRLAISYALHDLEKARQNLLMGADLAWDEIHELVETIDAGITKINETLNKENGTNELHDPADQGNEPRGVG